MNGSFLTNDVRGGIVFGDNEFQGVMIKVVANMNKIARDEELRVEMRNQFEGLCRC